MYIDELTIGQFKELKSLIEDNAKEYSTKEKIDLGLRIVILQRGWVFIGDLSQQGEYRTIKNTKNIHRWGTTGGLGELKDGPTKKTVLHDAGTVHYHKLTEIASIECNQKNWSDIK